MAGVADPWKLNEVGSADEACGMLATPEHAPGVRYARVFAEADGRGAKAEAAFAALAKATSEGEAKSVRAICWFLYWGSYTGNTLNGIMGRKEGKELSMVFKALMCAPGRASPRHPHPRPRTAALAPVRHGAALRCAGAVAGCCTTGPCSW